MNPVPHRVLLLVEDDSSQALMVKTDLETYGYTVITATSEEMASRLCETNRKHGDTWTDRVELTMKAANVAWWEMDIATGRVSFARQKTDMLGFSSEPFTHYQDFTRLVHPDDFEQTMQAMRDHFSGVNEKYETEYRIRTQSGEYKWFYDIGSISKRDGNGTPLMVAGIVIDITERKLADKKILTLLSEKELILKEVHHRIKNNMNAIYGLLVLQANSMTDTPAVEALQDAGKRVRSMQVLYDRLYRSSNYRNLLVSDYFTPLIDDILSHFPDYESLTVDKHIDSFVLDATFLQPLGIIINEVLTNSMKHAFASVSDRRIGFSATIEGDLVTVRIADNGGGMPEAVTFDTSSGFGLTLVSGLAKQIDATVRIERTEGTAVIIEFEK